MPSCIFYIKSKETTVCSNCNFIMLFFFNFISQVIWNKKQQWIFIAISLMHYFYLSKKKQISCFLQCHLHLYFYISCIIEIESNNSEQTGISLALNYFCFKSTRNKKQQDCCYYNLMCVDAQPPLISSSNISIINFQYHVSQKIS